MTSRIITTLTILLIAVINTNVIAATAIAVNKSTGAVGWAYGQSSEDEAKKLAKENCNGNCEIIASSGVGGFGAVLRTHNNFISKEGEKVEVSGFVALKKAVGVRDKLAGPCAECTYLAVWYDNSKTASGKELNKGAGGKKAPELITWKVSEYKKSYSIHKMVIDGRVFDHGYSIRWQTTEKKDKYNQVELHYNLEDGKFVWYDFEAGEEEWYKAEKYYSRGYLHGPHRYFSPDDKVIKYEEYIDDKKNGYYEKRGNTGALTEQGWYKNGKKNGHWKKYSKGKLSSEGDYVFDKQHGIWTSYSTTTGEIKYKKRYAKGKFMEEIK